VANNHSGLRILQVSTKDIHGGAEKVLGNSLTHTENVVKDHGWL